jgi:hypothetical protein
LECIYTDFLFSKILPEIVVNPRRISQPAKDWQADSPSAPMARQKAVVVFTSHK